jgi:hypothetical protein
VTARAADVAGLPLALFGPLAVAWGLPRLFRAPESLAAGLVCQAALAALVVATAWLGGARPAAPTAWSLVYAALLTALFVLALGPWLMRLPARLGLRGFESGLRALAPLPPWYLALAVAIGGCAEEWLYRAYAFERASALFGDAWLGGALVVTAFGVAHLPLWGLGPSLTTLVSGAIATAFYAATRDLAALALSHVATDFVGIVLPALRASRGGPATRAARAARPRPPASPGDA